MPRQGRYSLRGQNMRLPIRPMVGLSAAATTMGFVILAGVTAPRAEPAMHASAKCPDEAKESPLPAPAPEAKTPA
jgi:hypothetical protein